MNDSGFGKFLALACAVALAAFGITRLLQRQRKPRSFREDPIGALKDRGELVASRAQAAGEDALGHLQSTLDEIRDRLPEGSRKRFRRGRKDLNARIGDLSSQAQDLVKDLRSSRVFGR